MRRSSLLTLALALSMPLGVSIAGCTAITNFGSFHPGTGSDGGLDASSSDTGPVVDAARDAGPAIDVGPMLDAGPSSCSPACTRPEECCGTTCIDTSRDPANCHGCGVICDTLDNATPACDATGCSFECVEHFDDCDGERSNGCEQSLTAVAHCGSCDHDCGTMLCDGATGACLASCDAPRMECDGSCVDVLGDDVSHCGSCDPCPTLTNTTRSCNAGRCSYACVGGYADCNGDLDTGAGSDGCESMLRTYYTDSDGDGFGVGAAMMGCTMPMRTSAAGGDCNDADGSVYPGAMERCNGTNDDCDLNVDEGLAYMGVGVGGSCSCEAGAASGTVVCSSGSATCGFPAEICNGADDDCDGADDDGFSCVRGATMTCSMSLGFCSFVGTRTCDGTCNFGACTPPAETCNGMDDDCDGLVDEGLGTLRPAVGGFSDGMPTDRFVAAAWYDAAHGGAALVVRENPTTPRTLMFRRFDGTGAPLGSYVTLAMQTAAEMSTSMGVNTPAAIAWDGSNWLVFYMNHTSSGGEIRRVTISLDGGTVSSPMVEATGMSSVAVSRAPSGDVGVVFGRYDFVMAGVWRAGVWARVPTTVMSGRASLDYAQVTWIPGRFLALSSDLGGTATGIVATTFDAAGTTASVYSYLNGGPNEIDTRVAFEAVRGRVVITFRDASTGVPSAVLLDPATMGIAGTVTSIGVTSNGPRVDAGNGEIYAGLQPDFRRLRADTAAPYGETYDGALYTDVVLATPGATQRALTFAGGLAPISGPATRRFTCP